MLVAFFGGAGGLAEGAGAEEDVVAAVGVEGRVEVDEVDGGVGEVVGVTQDGEVVAVEEGVGGGHGGGLNALFRTH